MRTETGAPAPDPVRLAEYRPPDWLVEHCALDIALDADATRVRARLRFRRNRAAGDGPADLRLDGKDLTLLSCAVDGRALDPGALARGEESLTIPAAALPGDAFLWEAETRVAPAANTSLEGLYVSEGMFCTQCEAEGFRKITFYPDRPDVMAPFETRIEADAARCPVLLSNGDPGERGALEGGRHFAVWRDPHPKPSYLFALVAGDLVAESRTYRTPSGRDVTLNLWVRPGDEGKTGYALDSLERAMRWDEAEYGREYDLSVFNVVAVSDFNMGAMENKGLNIFNSKYVLASPETATDRDYELIESIVAHEYFHNWTGNRITCRDWFQLCLKEGLTVFRDQQFSGDLRSEPVKRIEDVKRLRAQQFREDAGPLAHPVRPEQYVEINNFYTATVYEKGAEVIRMLRTLVGPEGYRKALDLYFSRHDGDATTIEAFRRCFEDALGLDLSRFARWWSQAGTPVVTVSEDWDAGAGRYALTFRQETRPTPGQPEKAPVVIPIALGLLDAQGEDLLSEGTRIVTLEDAETTVAFDGLAARPVPSLLRGFSAPVRMERAGAETDRAFLLAHDSDPFNRWEAGQTFAMDAMLRMLEGAAPDPALVAALGALAGDERLDPAFRALALDPPSEDDVAGEVAERGRPADPEAIHRVRAALKRAVAEAHGDALAALHDAMATPGPYSPDAAAAGRRALRNRCLDLLVAGGTEAAFARAERQFREADNMTERAPALAALVHADAPQAAEALASFRAAWEHDALVMDKWFAIQAAAPVPDALERVRALTEDPAFAWLNPNRFRSVVGVFAMGNPSRFHAADGSGYAFLADWLIRLDARNPQTAARLAGAFETWRRYDEARRTLIRAALERILAADALSKDTGDIVRRILAG